MQLNYQIILVYNEIFYACRWREYGEMRKIDKSFFKIKTDLF